MPRIFIYEHICALGLGREPGSPEHSLFAEGRAMLSAVTADFAAVPGVEVVTFPEVPPAQHPTTFARLAGSSDWTFLIAPETGGELQRLAQMVLASGGKLLGPSPEAVEMTAEKWYLSYHWGRFDVPTPQTHLARRPDGSRLSWPPREDVRRNGVICKPRDGCGSEQTYLIRTAEEWAALPHDPNRIVQEYVPGQAASVAFLVGPKQTVPLLPMFQHLSGDGRFRYLGGSLPIPPELAERAVRLGSQAIGCVPGLFGYVGVDLVLGERDVAIEINPRLTTSYVGLRALAETNLAGAMLDVCEGRPVDVKWKAGRVVFRSDGTGNAVTG